MRNRTDQLASNGPYDGFALKLTSYSNAINHYALMYFVLKSEMNNLLLHGELISSELTRIESDMNWAIKGMVDAIEAWGYHLESFILTTLAPAPDQ